jgi:hypothetical protein
MRGITQEHYLDSDGAGNPAGGFSAGTGIQIEWQNGPLAVDGERREPNGAFVEDVIAAAIGWIEFYQSTRFHSLHNAVALGRRPRRWQSAPGTASTAASRARTSCSAGHAKAPGQLGRGLAGGSRVQKLCLPRRQVGVLDQPRPHRAAHRPLARRRRTPRDQQRRRAVHDVPRAAQKAAGAPGGRYPGTWHLAARQRRAVCGGHEAGVAGHFSE